LVGNQGTTTERADQRGLITEVHWVDGLRFVVGVVCEMRYDSVHKSTENRLCPIQHNRVGGLSGFS
jgi:hypothetical protein